MSDPQRAKYARTLVVLHLTVPEHFADGDGKSRLIGALEETFAAHTTGSGPGDTTLQAIFIRTERGDKLSPVFEQMRTEYPLRPERPSDACDNQGMCPECRAEGGVSNGEGTASGSAG